MISISRCITRFFVLAYQQPYNSSMAFSDVAACPAPLGGDADYYTCLGALGFAGSDALTVVSCIQSSNFKTLFANRTNPNTGTTWYFQNSTVGFYPSAAGATLVPHDVATASSSARLSWVLNQGRGGFRAGSSVNLTSDLVWQKVIYCVRVGSVLARCGTR